MGKSSNLKVLEFCLKDPSKTITIEKIKQILSSHIDPICQHGVSKTKVFGKWFVSLTLIPDSGCTGASVIYKLSKPPELYIALGNPCTNEYDCFTF